ncbi:MAG: hypothetical protein IJF05_00095 [Clostridia bacterium]|nr:hypothetical protein [Clostridia bacterium]
MRPKKSILFLTILIAAVVILSAAATVSAEDGAVDAMVEINADATLSSYKLWESQTLSTDGYIGIPVELSIYYDASKTAKPGEELDATPVILYVVNAGFERIGQSSDVEIITNMVSRGWAVCVADYKNDKRAVSPDLDWSAERLKSNLMRGTYFSDKTLFPKGTYSNGFIVPAGYDVSMSHVYWEIDKHSTAGTLEKIVEIWNNDFRSVNAETVIKWTDENGNRKQTQTAHDGSSPIWLNAEGEADENGEYIKIKHTLAEKITDCVKRDGRPIDLNLYMHLIYPTGDVTVPVITYVGAQEHLATGVADQFRPQMGGIVFRGYAGIMYDHGYTPMARNDHYGYFDGSTSEGRITGDNVTYSIQFYNLVNIHTAAMRYIRYLSLSDDRFNFELDSIGTFGYSKGGWMTFLGEEDPYSSFPRRIHEGHYGETRYENGETETVGIIDGGEVQPWLTYNGEEIDAHSNFIYASCGGASEAITPGHAPTFITCNLHDGSYYTSSNHFLNACRSADVPTMWLEADVAHTLGYGADLNYGVDVYEAFFNFAGYWLKGDAVSVEYIHADLISDRLPTTAPIVIKFTGSVERSEVEKITLCAGDYTAGGRWESQYGNTEWSFYPDCLLPSTEYTLTIPKSLVGSNGKEIGEEVSYTALTQDELSAEGASIVHGERGRYITVTLPDLSAAQEINKYTLRVRVENDAVNTLSAYLVSGFNPSSPDSSVIGERVGSTYVNGAGYYEIDVTEAALSLSGESTFLIKSEKAAAESVVYSTEFNGSISSTGLGISGDVAKQIIEFDGDNALKLGGFKLCTSYPNNYFYNNIHVIKIIKQPILSSKLTYEDTGRRFTVSFKVYDTVSRYLNLTVSSPTDPNTGISDFNATELNVLTVAGEWVDVSFSFDIHEPEAFGANGLIKKEFFISTYGFGTKECPIYFDDFVTTEITTEVEIDDGGISLVLSNEVKEKNPLETEYGLIPEAYKSVEDYPFVLFEDNGDGTYSFVAAENNIFADASPLMIADRTIKGVILMRRDFTTADRFSNVNFVAYGLLFDMDGHTLYCESKDSSGNDTSPYYACIKRATHSELTFINGTIVVGNAPFVSIDAKNSKGTGYSISFNFRNVDFVLKEGGTTDVLTVKYLESTMATSSRITFDGCSFDLSAGAPDGGIAIFGAGHSSNKVTAEVSVCGGGIIANDMDGIKIADVAEGSSFYLVKGEGGYTTVTLSSGGRATDESLPLEDGTEAVLVKTESRDGADVYYPISRAVALPKLHTRLSLHSDFVYTVYVPIKNVTAIEIEGAVYELSALKRVEIDGEECYAVPFGISASRAAEDILLSLSALAEDMSFTATRSLSLTDYLSDLIEAGETDEEVRLVKDILSYIRSIYKYADREGADEVISKIDGIIGADYDKDSIPDTEIEKAEKMEGLSAALQLEDGLSFIFYVNGELAAEQYEIRVNGEVKKCEIAEAEDGRIYIKVRMNAYETTDTVTYTVAGTDVGGEYNIRAYYDFAVGEDSSLAELVLRIWKYSESARAYKTAQNI